MADGDHKMPSHGGNGGEDERPLERLIHPGSGRRKATATPKGRQVEPEAAAEIKALLGFRPRSRDLLIEFLHLIQDRYGYISGAHLAALAAEMKLAMTEVYEVATFYHHFDVVKEGEAAPPALTVRVCTTYSCAMAGGEKLLAEVARLESSGVRVLPAPCIGRCEHAPAAVVGRRTIDEATPAKIADAVTMGDVEAVAPPYIDYAAYRAAGANARYEELSSPYGHDAFLMEFDRVTELLRG